MRKIERAFADHLAHQRGLVRGTIENQLRDVRGFLSAQFPRRQRIVPGDIGPVDIARFVALRMRTVGPGRGRGIASSIRSFCRFLRLRGDIETDLAASVLSVAAAQTAVAVKAISPKEVERVLARCSRRTPVGLRNYAILLLLARLGLRDGEVAAMTLDDIDWRAGEILIRGKGPRHDRLPLPRDVGEALAAYVRRGRPSCSTRRLFIRALEPRRGLVSVYQIVARALGHAGLRPPIRGAHLFRYTLATNMLRRGASLAEIGQVLRHRDVDSTAIYARVDVSGLRSIAPPWPGA